MSEHKNNNLSKETVQLVTRLVVDGLLSTFGKNPKKEAIEAAADAIIKYFPYIETSFGRVCTAHFCFKLTISILF